MLLAADLLANPARALFVGFVLLVNHGYKTVIGYESCKEFLNYIIVPVRMQQLEKKQLPESQCKVVNLHGLRLPAKWSPRVVHVYKMGIEVKAVTLKAAKLTIHVTPTPNGIDEYSGFGSELLPLALKAFRGRYGSWKRFRAEFKDDRSMLEDIFGAKLPKHLTSRILPLFPPVSAHWRQTMLLTAKSFTAHRMRIWSLT
ncbi:MAG: hypothetical protein IID45_12850, partial [Planctomycetes bacterium]|nr:hypothetical protein [Planctomycetota bacterium]